MILPLADSVIAGQTDLRTQRPPQGFRLPGARDRQAIMGRTGSGKTHFATWALSQQNWPHVPWSIIDYKRDGLLGDLPADELAVTAKAPRHPGLYVVHPRPDEADEVEAYLWRLWERGRGGVFVDEAHILPDKGGLQAILTQGRSKGIPAIVVTQRPAWVSRFTFSEADYISAFHLNDKRDRQTVAAFLPVDIERTLPARHSWFYDVSRDRAYRMLPVPGQDEILDIYDRRSHKTKWRKI
jgi:DNA helicase HerA-like ATPase